MPEALRYLSHQSGKWCSLDEQVSLFLIMSDLTESKGTWSVPMFSFCSALGNPCGVLSSSTHSLSTSPSLWISAFFTSYWYRCTLSSSSLWHCYHSGFQSGLYWGFSLNVQHFTSDCSRCSICVIFCTRHWSQLLISIYFIIVPNVLNWSNASLPRCVAVFDDFVYHLQCPPSLSH